MECNKDEALRAKSIAEGKLENKDFIGAKKFVLKARALYPGLEGISQLLTTLDVYVSAENKTGGEVDWYAVLGVNPSADDETIRKQYRKLALMLHPDKNKSVGAEGAFKLISEAWNLLSDKAKRLAYNQRRAFKGSQQKVLMQSGGPSAQSRSKGFYNFGNGTTSDPKTKNYAKVPGAKVTPPSNSKKHDTFWTICDRCEMRYEYLKIYLNRTLLCRNCQKGFMASEIAPPAKFSKSSKDVLRQHLQNSRDHIHSKTSFDSGRNAAVDKNSEPSTAEKAATVHQTQNSLKRQFTEALNSTRGEEYVKNEKIR